MFLSHSKITHDLIKIISNFSIYLLNSKEMQELIQNIQLTLSLKCLCETHGIALSIEQIAKNNKNINNEYIRSILQLIHQNKELEQAIYKYNIIQEYEFDINSENNNTWNDLSTKLSTISEHMVQIIEWIQMVKLNYIDPDGLKKYLIEQKYNTVTEFTKLLSDTKTINLIKSCQIKRRMNKHHLNQAYNSQTKESIQKINELNSLLNHKKNVSIQYIQDDEDMKTLEIKDIIENINNHTNKIDSSYEVLKTEVTTLVNNSNNLQSQLDSIIQYKDKTIYAAKIALCLLIVFIIITLLRYIVQLNQQVNYKLERYKAEKINSNNEKYNSKKFNPDVKIRNNKNKKKRIR